MSAEPLAGKNRIPDIISQGEMILGASNAADASEKIDVSERRKIVMESGRGSAERERRRAGAIEPVIDQRGENECLMQRAVNRFFK